MKIGIDAADLCDQRVDGTRIYIKNILDQLGGIDQEDIFLIYLKGELTKKLYFRSYPNYQVKKTKSFYFWTQLRLPWEIKKDPPQVLWMPLQTVPFLNSRKIRTVVTIHDLAFKYYKNHFPRKDQFLLSLFTEQAVRRADKIIAVSQNTKRDIQKFYGIAEEKIKVIYHGFDKNIFNEGKAKNQTGIHKIKEKYGIKFPYLLYAGAIQPRKNIGILIKVFEKLKTQADFSKLQLVIAGQKAWLYQEIFKQIEESRYTKDIILTGSYETEELPFLLGGAEIFVFPSLYEGFGIPVLEAMACGVPIVAGKNSSIQEIGGEAPLYFEATKEEDLSQKIIQVLRNPNLQEEMKKKGLRKAQLFSWEKCAQETLAVLKGN